MTQKHQYPKLNKYRTPVAQTERSYEEYEEDQHYKENRNMKQPQSLSKEEFTNWKQSSETKAKYFGFPVKIVSSKWNLLKNILAVLGIIAVALLAISFFVSAAASNSGNNGFSFLTIKHELVVDDALKTQVLDLWKNLKQVNENPDVFPAGLE